MANSQTPRDALFHTVLEDFEQTQIPWLKQVVEMPSHTYQKEAVEKAFAPLDAMAEELGLRCEVVPSEDERFADHRIYRSAAAEKEKSTALVGHLDTVFPPSMNFFDFEREGDVIRGPGTLDMKSGLSAMFFACAAFKKENPKAYSELPISIVVVSDEEIGSVSSAPLYAELAPSLKEALVFEAGREEDKIVTSRKGAAGYRVDAVGLAAHAGLRHAQGKSAVWAIARVIDRLEKITDYERGITVNVGMVSGGTAKNTVPDAASCVIDVRFLRAEDAAFVDEALNKALVEPDEELPPRVRDVELKLSGGVSRPPMQATEATQALRKSYEAHASAAGLKIGEAPLQGGGSDANILASHGVPVIDGLGPYGKHFHKPEEWSLLSSLLKRTQALAAFLAERAGAL